jgi:hypothetical protein
MIVSHGARIIESPHNSLRPDAFHKATRSK